jgi:chromosome segregation ATPase
MRLQRQVAPVCADLADSRARLESAKAVTDGRVDAARQAASRVRVQLARMRFQVSRLQGRRENLDAERALWQQRATALTDAAGISAIECRERSRRLDIRLSAIEAQLDLHLRVARDLRRRLGDLEERLKALQPQPTVLSSGRARGRTTRIGLARPPRLE